MLVEPLSPPEARRLIREIIENGSWRYRVRTARMAVIVAFRSETALRVVTAWRFKS